MSLVRALPKYVVGGFPQPRGVNCAAFWAENSQALVSVGAVPSAPDQSIFTLSFWMHRSRIDGGQQLILTCPETDCQIQLNGERLRFYQGSGPFDVSWVLSGDSADWYHVCIRYNSRQGSADQRVILQLNGVVAPTSGSPSWPTLNASCGLCHGIGGHYIGRHHSSGNNPFDGRLFDFIFVGGQDRDCTGFGENVDRSWIPLTDPSGVTWHNGCYRLQFNDSGNLGLDTKPSGTPIVFTNTNGIVQWQDNPMDACCQMQTWLPSTPPNNAASMNFARNQQRACTRHNYASTTRYMAMGSLLLPTSVDWMCEVTMQLASTTIYIGWAERRLFDNSDRSYVKYGWINLGNGAGAVNDTGAPGGTRSWSSKYNLAQPDTVAIGIDSANKNFVIVKPDNDWSLEAWPGMPEEVVFFLWDDPTGFPNQKIIDVNFGQAPRIRTWPPGDWKECRKSNLPEVGFQASDLVTYADRTGTGVDTDVALPFDDGLTWWKRHDGTYDHFTSNEVLGVDGGNNRQRWMRPNNNAQVNTFSASEMRLQAPGRRVIGSNPALNQLNAGYMDLHWAIGIEYGFHIFHYLQTGSRMVVPHGFGEVPDVVVTKQVNRDGGNWNLLARSFRDDETEAWQYFVRFQSPNAYSNSTRIFYQSPDATNLYIESGDPNNNNNGTTAEVWCLKRRPGLFDTGFYYGNGQAEGPFIPMPMLPGIFIGKKLTGSEDWGLQDRGRSPFNPVTRTLRFDNTAESTSGQDTNFTHGIRVMNSAGRFNQSGQRYFFMAWAEQAYKRARAR